MTQRERLGKYEILEVLGRGAMGVVFKGFDPGIDRTVAIKTVRKELIEDDDRAGMALARFRNEARAAGRLAHPGIVAVYDYGESESVTYIAMEYVQGNSLREYFNLGTRFSEADVVSIMAQLLEALQHAHDAGVWHRDIKPANLIIMANGRLKIADFGIARIEASQLTQTGVVMGSPGYMAPEQYSGGTIDWRADLFAAAVVMHQLLTGVRLYTGSAEQVAYKICHQEPPSPSMVDPGKGWERYDALLLRALAKNPDHRFASATAFREAILQAYAAPVSAAVSEETILATMTRPAGVFEPSNPAARTGDPSASAGSRATPTPPPLAPPPMPSPARQPSAEASSAAATPPVRRWPLIAGAVTAAIAGALLGGWWVSRSPVDAPASKIEVAAKTTPARPAPPSPLAKPVVQPPSAKQPAPQKAERPAPPKAERPASSKAERPASSKAERPASSKAERPASPKAERPAPRKAERPAPPKPISPAKASPKPLPTVQTVATETERALSTEPAQRPSAAERRQPPAPERPATKEPGHLADRPAAVSPPPSDPTSKAGTAAAPDPGSASPLGAPPEGPVATASPVPAIPASVETAAVEPASAKVAPQPSKPPPPPPSIWRDQGITMKVAGKIQFNRRLWSSGIQVETIKGIVHLRGTVSSQALSDEAEKIAANVYGVHGVKNEIKISP